MAISPAPHTPRRTRPLRAIVYVRLSVHRGDEDPSTSPAEQERKGRAYAEAQGWDVVDVVEDLDVSGSAKGLRLDRPGLAEIRARFADIDVVIFAKLDRLARNVLDFNTFAEEARRADVALVSVAEALDLSTPSGRFVAQILAAFAEMEAATIAARVTEGRAALRSLRRHSGPAPYGYRTAPHASGSGVGLVVDPAEAAVVRDAAEMLLGGSSLYATARALNDAGRLTRRGARWGASSLRALVTGEAVLGRMVHKGRALVGPDGLPEPVWEPILDEETSARLRALYPAYSLPRVAHPDDKDAVKARHEAAARNRREAHRARGAWLLSGLLECATCGSVMHGAANGTPTHVPPRGAEGPRGPRALRYTCGAATGACVRPVAVNGRRVEEYLVEEYLARFGAMEVVEIREISARDTVRLASVERALADATDAMREPGADVAALAARVGALVEERDRLATEPAEVRREAVPTGRSMAEAWTAAGDDADALRVRRGLLSSALAGRVVVRPGERGRNWLDPARLSIPWTWEVDPEADALAGQLD